MWLIMRGMLLAIETSQRNSSVAVGTLSLEAQLGDFLSESIDTSDRQKEDILPAIERLCARAQVTREHIGALALNAGPGGFSGLRIAHAAAQVIGEAWSIPIVQISAAVVAREAAVVSELIVPEQSVWVALASKSDGCWMAKVLNSRDGNDVPQQMGVRDLNDWPLQTGDALITDEHLPERWRAKALECGNSIIALQPTAQAVWRVACRLLSRGHHVSPEHILPVYPREAEAVRLWRERHGTN